MVTLSFASIGKITAINGKAYAIRDGQRISLLKGSDIEKKDLIKTMDHTKLQIVFNDHTVISLGQKTSFKIDDYVFSKRKVKASFSVSKGIFKSITGRIGKIDHSKFKLRTKNATIGVRGTTFIGVVDEDKESIACTSGEIVVENGFGAVAVKAGEITSFRAFEAPRPARVLNKNFIKQVRDVKPEINSDNIVVSSPIVQTEPDTQADTLSGGITDKLVDTDTLSDTDEIAQEPLPVLPVETVISQTKEDKVEETTYIQKVDTPVKIVKEEPSLDDEIAVVKDPLDDKLPSIAPPTVDEDEFVDSDFNQDDMEAQEPTVDSDLVADLQELKDKVGGVTQLHYEGVATGTFISPCENRVSLDVDLGEGRINGNMQFTHGVTGYDVDIAGNFVGGNHFNVDVVNSGYSGQGVVDLEGEQLENATGGVIVTKEGHSQISVGIIATRGAR